MYGIRKLAYYLLLLVILSASGLVVADSCPIDFSTAIEALNEHCATTTVGEACVPHGSVQVSFVDGIMTSPTLPVNNISLSTLRTLDTSDNAESVVLMRVNHPLIDNEAMTMLAVGEVKLANRAVSDENAPLVTVTIKIPNGVNVRSGPTTDSPIIEGLAAGDEVIGDGRNKAANWLRLTLEDGRIGWVFAPLVTVEGDIMLLRNFEVTLGDSGGRSPMQVLDLTSISTCTESPAGLVVQTPTKWGISEIVINEIALSLRGTAFLQSFDGETQIFMLSGLGWTTSIDSGMFIPAGSVLRITLNGGTKTAILEPYAEELLSHLPLEVMPESVTLTAPLSPDAIEIHTQGITPDKGQWRLTADTAIGDCPFVPFFLLPNLGFIPSFDGARLRQTAFMNGREIGGPWAAQIVSGVYTMEATLADSGAGQQILYVVSPTLIEWYETDRKADGSSVCVRTGRYVFANS